MKNPFISKKYSIKHIYGKEKKGLLTTVIATCFSFVFLLIGFLIYIGVIRFPGELLTWVDLMVLSVLSVIGPIGFYNHLMVKKKKDVENQLPDFLREISGSTASGMTVFEAIKSAAKGDHGRLTPELQKMSSQLSWGISVNEAINNFANRLTGNLPL